MVTQVEKLPAEKFGDSKAGFRVVGTSRSENSETKWMFRMGTEKVWCSQPLDEEAGAENDPPLYSSRIINNYIEYLQEYHPDIEIKSILEYAGMAQQEVEDAGYWFSQQQTDRFHEIIVWKQIRNAMFFFGLSAALIFFPIFPQEAWLALVLTSSFLYLTTFFNSQRLEKKELIKTIESQGNAARDLMDEMNIRHNNALLIQETGQAISKILDVDRIIDTVVAGMEKHLYFDRGMILLCDPTKSRLQYIAGFGYTSDQESILCDQEFNLENSDGEGNIIRAFNEQKPFWVKNVAEIGKELSRKRRSLIRQMGVRSFVCVPLVYEKEALGVLVVENNSSQSQIAQSEINLLTGVASQTAISCQVHKENQRKRATIPSFSR